MIVVLVMMMVAVVNVVDVDKEEEVVKGGHVVGFEVVILVKEW